MTGRRTAADAAEAAELQALAARAEQSRRELGETVHALAGKLARDTDLRGLARRELAQLTTGAEHTASAAAYRIRRADYPRIAPVLATATVLLAVAVLWYARLRAHRHTG